MNNGMCDKAQNLGWPTGALMLVRRDVLIVQGLLDSGNFMYLEVIDRCRRLWRVGFRIIYYPALSVACNDDMKSISFLTGKSTIHRHIYYYLHSQIRNFVKYGFKRYMPVAAAKRDAM